MASQGRYVPPARGRFLFRQIGHFWPLTSGLALWHNVRRRPRRVLLGLLSPRFSFPCAVGFFFRSAGRRSVGWRSAKPQAVGWSAGSRRFGRPRGGAYIYIRTLGLPAYRTANRLPERPFFR